MRIDDHGHLVLSRRNLQALLNKLDRPDSARTLVGGTRAPGVVIKAEEDQQHYADVPFAGPVHPLDGLHGPRPSPNESNVRVEVEATGDKWETQCENCGHIGTWPDELENPGLNTHTKG